MEINNKKQVRNTSQQRQHISDNVTRPNASGYFDDLEILSQNIVHIHEN